MKKTIITIVIILAIAAAAYFLFFKDASKNEEDQFLPSTEEVRQQILSQFPAEARDCVNENLSDSTIEKIQEGEMPQEKILELVEDCQSFMEGAPSGM